MAVDGPIHLVGKGPAELRGRFLRNGDGMVHSLASDGGGSPGPYRNRYVRTPLWAHPGRSRMALAFDAATGRIDFRVTTANTHLVAHAGRLLALEEGGFPYEITRDLATVGPFDFGGALTTPMTAHPKFCLLTGELVFFGHQLRPPYVTVHVAAPGGEMVASVRSACRRRR